MEMELQFLHQNGRVAQEAVKGLQAGMIGVNIGIPVPREPFAFGGIKYSRFGQRQHYRVAQCRVFYRHHQNYYKMESSR